MQWPALLSRATFLSKLRHLTLKELGINKANVKATDKGALDCTIKARVTAAAVRSTGVDVWA